MFNTFFSENTRGRKDCPYDNNAKLMIVKQSYFIQCCDLISADIGLEVSDENRDLWKEVIAAYLMAFPAASFEDFTGAIATEMLANGEMKGKEKKNAKEYINKLRSKRGY